MCIVTISQPRYMPACNYIHRMILSDIFIYLDIVKYSPRDWEHRNRLKLSNGSAGWISVPVIHQHSSQLIKEVRIDNNCNWARKHLNTLIYNYGKAKYFDKYIDFFKELYNGEWEYLEDLNISIIDFIVKQLGITCKFIKASELETDGKGQDLLIKLCSRVGGDIYLSGPMGANYINEKSFQTSGIRLIYHNYTYPVYPQMHGDFISWMSFFDLLFNCGDDSIRYLNRGNVSKEDILKE